MRAKSAVSGVLAAFLGAAIAGCGGDPPAPDPVVRPIKMLEVGGDVQGTREYPGRIRAGQQIDMAFEVSGRVVEWVYNEGTPVEEDSILASLDPRDYQNQLRQALALQQEATTYLSRIEQAYESRAVPEQDLTHAQAQVEVARAEVRIKRKALEDTKLRAPFDGVMSRKLVEDFANVSAKQAVLVFEDTSQLEVKVSVPERDLAGRRRPGDIRETLTERLRPEVEVTSLPDDRFPARLKEIATHADPTTRTYQATFRFDSPEDIVILPGMTAKVIVHLDTLSESGFTIPALAAVVDAQDQPTVWLVDPESMTVRRQPVTLGDLMGDNVIVESGLSHGDLVAISGVAQLREGMKVRRWERPSGAP